jgi:hypothetical protein
MPKLGLDVPAFRTTLRRRFRCGNSGAHCGLYVSISHPRLLTNLQYFLRRAACVAEQRPPHELEVSIPSAPSADQARREVNVYLASWQARNPGVETSIVERDEELGDGSAAY